MYSRYGDIKSNQGLAGTTFYTEKVISPTKINMAEQSEPLHKKLTHLNKEKTLALDNHENAYHISERTLKQSFQFIH